MTQKLYDELWHYSEQFTRDKLQRSELVTMAWKEGVKLGERCTPGLMKSVMHFRSKELYQRSAFPAEEVGKRKVDAWNHQRVYVDRKVRSDGGVTTLADFLLSLPISPLDFAIANDFMDSLTAAERRVTNDLMAGYTLKDITIRRKVTSAKLSMLQQSIRRKAVAYL